MTGVSMVLTEIAAKALEVFKDAVPNAVRIGVLWNPTTPSHTEVMRAVDVASKHLSVQLVSTPAANVADFDGAFSAMAREHADGFLVPSSPLTNSARVPLAELQFKYRLPGMFVNEENVLAGGFMSYGAASITCIGAPHLTSTRFSKAKSRASFPSSKHPNISWS